ncbi:hypothetical protein I6F35_31995 [Bradyrhizobium sp. BRP22]|nr:hypothetical protein [Bradyrhizobium sp. BRP22]MCA1457754.1 hypothetical protein [Bradyrhizobium sp. BRP22]
MKDGTAAGALIEVSITIKPGTASASSDGRMTEAEAIAYDNQVILLLLVT